MLLLRIRLESSSAVAYDDQNVYEHGGVVVSVVALQFVIGAQFPSPVMSKTLKTAFPSFPPQPPAQKEQFREKVSKFVCCSLCKNT